LSSGAIAGVIDWTSDAGELREVLPVPMLLSGEVGYAFYRACVPPLDGGACQADEWETRVRAIYARDAGTLWESKVLDAGVVGWLEEAAAVSLGPGAVVALTSQQLDGGVHAQVDLFAVGETLFSCPLPANSRVAGAVFDRGFVFVLVERGGVWTLEAYDLANLPLSTSGWPQAYGVSGSRRGRP
jgi:hypothetical protein